MFELEQFVADCRVALKQESSHKFVREVVSRAVSDPAQVLKALGGPKRAEMQILHRSDDLTILNVIWAPWMTLLPHNHQMWAVIGIYTGREDNIFWRRVPGTTGGKVEAAGARALCTKDAEPLGPDIIHFRHESYSPFHWSHSRLWRRLLCSSAQRVGRREPSGTRL